MNYKRYSIENNKFINELTFQIINEIIEKIISNYEIYDNYFDSKKKEETDELLDDYVFYFKSFLNLGNYLNNHN
jgi:hypothetical protein